MEDFRSKSYRDGRMQMQSYSYHYNSSNPNGFQDFRCYKRLLFNLPSTTSTAGKEMKFKKGNSAIGSSSSVKSWSFGDPELQRKRRVASYEAYSVERKVKGSLRNSFGWLKDRCS